MKKSVQSIQLKDGGQLLVEVEEAVLSDSLSGGKFDPDLPPGCEEIGYKGIGGKVKDVAELLRQNLSGMFETVAEAMEKSKPDEWGMEISIGFKGTTNPIPVILGGEANAAIKVHAKWTKSKEVGQQNG